MLSFFELSSLMEADDPLAQVHRTIGPGAKKLSDELGNAHAREYGSTGLYDRGFSKGDPREDAVTPTADRTQALTKMPDMKGQAAADIDNIISKNPQRYASAMQIPLSKFIEMITKDLGTKRWARPSLIQGLLMLTRSSLPYIDLVNGRKMSKTATVQPLLKIEENPNVPSDFLISVIKPAPDVSALPKEQQAKPQAALDPNEDKKVVGFDPARYKSGTRSGMGDPKPPPSLQAQQLELLHNKNYQQLKLLDDTGSPSLEREALKYRDKLMQASKFPMDPETKEMLAVAMQDAQDMIEAGKRHSATLAQGQADAAKHQGQPPAPAPTPAVPMAPPQAQRPAAPLGKFVKPQMENKSWWWGF